MEIHTYDSHSRRTFLDEVCVKEEDHPKLAEVEDHQVDNNKEGPIFQEGLHTHSRNAVVAQNVLGSG